MGPFLLQNLCRQVSTSANSRLVEAALHPKQFKYVDQLARYLEKHLILHVPGLHFFFSIFRQLRQKQGYRVVKKPIIPKRSTLSLLLCTKSKGRFLVLPKPYGISCIGVKTPGGGIFKDSVHKKLSDPQEDIDEARTSSDLTISECLPYLRRAFREEGLSFCLGLKRYLSGAIVLPANVHEYNNLVKSIQFATRDSSKGHTFHYNCLAILVGSPPNLSSSIAGFATFHSVGRHKEYKFVESNATKRAKTGKFAVYGSMDYEVLGKGNGCSLVKFSVNKFARHLPRLMFSHMMCPILGDQMYMRRLGDVDGYPVELQIGKRGKTYIPRPLLQRLALDNMTTAPMYCHVYQTEFPRYGWVHGKSKNEQDMADLFASCPPPSHFVAMVEALEMNDALRKFMSSCESTEPDCPPISGERTF